MERTVNDEQCRREEEQVNEAGPLFPPGAIITVIAAASDVYLVFVPGSRHICSVLMTVGISRSDP